MIYMMTEGSEWRIIVSGVFVLVMVASVTAGSGGRYGFFREMGVGRGATSDASGESRRVFGGAASELAEFPAACALLDRYWGTRCSCAVVAPRWALTAAHCVSSRLAYVKYNARRPASPEGDIAPVHYLYRHPGYDVVQEDRGRGPDVTALHHDVGLVRTRSDMKIETSPHLDPLVAMSLYNPADLRNEEVEVFGFGRTDRSPLGEELFSVRLQLVSCERGSWFHCVCGAWRGAGGWGRGPEGGGRGVCSGDSGGPAVYRGAQVAVTSMGPMECATRALSPPEGATSVFTSLYKYARLVNATIYDTEAELRMNIISSERRVSSSLLVLLMLPLLILMRLII